MRENLKTANPKNTALVQKQLHKRGISQKELTTTRVNYLKLFLQNYTSIDNYSPLEVAFIVNVDERFKASGLSIEAYIAKNGKNICEETIVDMYLQQYRGYDLNTIGRESFKNYSRICFGKNFEGELKQSIAKYTNLVEFFLVYDKVIVLNIIRKRERDRVKYQEVSDLGNLFTAVKNELSSRSFAINTKALSDAFDSETIIVEHLMYDVDATPPQRLEASQEVVSTLTTNLIAQLPKALYKKPSDVSSTTSVPTPPTSKTIVAPQPLKPEKPIIVTPTDKTAENIAIVKQPQNPENPIPVTPVPKDVEGAATVKTDSIFKVGQVVRHGVLGFCQIENLTENNESAVVVFREAGRGNIMSARVLVTELSPASKNIPIKTKERRLPVDEKTVLNGGAGRGIVRKKEEEKTTIHDVDALQEGLRAMATKFKPLLTPQMHEKHLRIKKVLLKFHEAGLVKNVISLDDLGFIMTLTDGTTDEFIYVHALFMVNMSVPRIYIDRTKRLKLTTRRKKTDIELKYWNLFSGLARILKGRLEKDRFEKEHTEADRRRMVRAQYSLTTIDAVVQRASSLGIRQVMKKDKQGNYVIQFILKSGKSLLVTPDYIYDAEDRIFLYKRKIKASTLKPLIESLSRNPKIFLNAMTKGEFAFLSTLLTNSFNLRKKIRVSDDKTI